MMTTQQSTQSVTEKQERKYDGFVIENGIITGMKKFHAINHESIGDVIMEFFDRKPDHITQIDAITEQKITCKELKERSIRLAIWMTKKGMKTGDIISLSSSMHLDVITIIIASFFVGATYAPIPQVLSLESARRLINNLKPRIMFTSKDNVGVLREAAQLENHYWEMISLDADLGSATFDNILESHTYEEILSFHVKSNIDPSNLCVIIPTSGTTGIPKFVCHTYGAIKIWVSAFCNFDHAEVQAEVTLTHLNPEWGIIYWLKYLLDGCTGIFQAKFDIHEFGKIIEKYKVNKLTTSTYITSLLCQDGTLDGYNLDSVSLVFPMGSKLYSAIEQKVRERFSNAAIDKGYGTSEVLDLTHTLCECLHPESAGIVFPNVQLKIVDVKSGSTLGPNQHGEICAKTPYSMTGYYKDPVNTKLAFDDEGWYRTGDLGYYEENGEIVVLGRSKELIRFRHFDIHPSYVEKMLLSHTNVTDVAVVGIQHDVDVEHPVAFVKVTQDASVTEDDLVEITRDLEYSDAFEDSIFFIDEIPRSSNGKIKRNILRERAEKVYAQCHKNV